MENKHKNLLNTLSKYSDAEWIDFIKRILLNLPLQIEIGLIQDYPEKILDSLNTLLDDDDNNELLRQFHNRLFDFYRDIKPTAENAKAISILHNLISRIKPVEYVHIIRQRFISEDFINLSYGRKNLHINLLAIISDFDNVANDTISRYLFTNVNEIKNNEHYLRVALNYFIKTKPDNYLKFLEFSITQSTPSIYTKSLTETFNSFISASSYKSIIDREFAEIIPKKVLFSSKESLLATSLSNYILYDKNTYIENPHYALLYMLLNKNKILPVNIILQFLSHKNYIEEFYRLDCVDLLSEYFNFIYRTYAIKSAEDLPSSPYIFNQDLSLFALNLNKKMLKDFDENYYPKIPELYEVTIEKDEYKEYLGFITEPPETKDEFLIMHNN